MARAGSETGRNLSRSALLLCRRGARLLIAQNIGGIIRGIKADGLAALLVAQTLGLGLSVDRSYVLNKGQIVCESAPDALRANEEVKRQYLGVSAGSGDPRRSPARLQPGEAEVMAELLVDD